MSQRFLVLSAMAVILPACLSAQKVAIMDRERVLAATSEGQAAIKTLNDKFGPRKAAFDKMNADLQAKQAAWSKATAAAKPALEAEINTLTAQVKNESDDAQQDMQVEQQRLFAPVMQKLQQVIDKYTAANQISLLLDSSANPNNLLFAEASTNVSEAIVAAYNKEAALPVAAPAAAPKPPATGTRPPAAPANRPAPGK